MTEDLPVPAAETSLTLAALSPMIAAELAAGLSTASSIRKAYGLSLEQWELLKKSDVFRAMLREAITKYRGDLNAGARITLKAETMLEDVLPDLYDIVKNRATPSSERINAVKELRELSGRNVKQAERSAGGGFTLNINLGDRKGLIIEGTATDPGKDNG